MRHPDIEIVGYFWGWNAAVTARNEDGGISVSAIGDLDLGF